MISVEEVKRIKKIRSAGIEGLNKMAKEHGMPALDAHKLGAENGDAHSQMTLGAMYGMALFVPYNYVLAYMWSNIALANGNVEGQNTISMVEDKMSHEQIGRAQDMALEWLENYSKKQKNENA